MYNAIFYFALARYVPETMGLTGKYLLATYAAILAIEAVIGFYILFRVFAQGDDGVSE